MFFGHIMAKNSPIFILYWKQLLTAENVLYIFSTQGAFIRGVTVQIISCKNENAYTVLEPSGIPATGTPSILLSTTKQGR